MLSNIIITLTECRDIATIVAAAVGAGTFIKLLMEYVQQGVSKRAEHFFGLRDRLKKNEEFQNICRLLDTDDVELQQVDFAIRRDFLGLFEEVALAVNSGLIREDVAHYMFGYYAIRCWASANFWAGLQRASIYSRVFKDFTARMRAAEDRLMSSKKRLIL